MNVEGIITHFLLIISITLFICSILQSIIRIKSKINYLMTLLFFIIAYLMLYFWMYRAGYLKYFSFLLYSDIAVTFIIGPLLYAYVKCLVGKLQKYTLKYFYRYIPGIIVFIFLLLYQPWEKTGILISDGLFPGYEKYSIVYILNILSDIYLFIYILFTIKLALEMRKKEDIEITQAIQRIFIVGSIALFAFAFFFAADFMHNNSLIFIGILISGANSVLFFFLSYRYPEIMQTISSLSRKQKKMKSYCGNPDTPDIIRKLDNLIEEKKIYLNPDLSLQSLSNLIGIESHHLSKLVHEHKKMSFREYINNYRLVEAKDLLVNDLEKSILDIAFYTGFNSKTPFNTSFKKATGFNPSEYRKNSRKIN